MKNFIKFIYFYLKNLVLIYGILIFSIICFGAIFEDLGNLIWIKELNLLNYNKLLNLSLKLLLSFSVIDLVITFIEYYWKKELPTKGVKKVG
jgi:hypothetical protein